MRIPKALNKLGLAIFSRAAVAVAPKPGVYAPGPACRHRGKPGDDYVCRCHRQMGNDFWFLPADRCLWDGK